MMRMRHGSAKLGAGAALWTVGALMLASLGGCEDMSRQDTLLVRGSTSATVFADAPIYVDRPLAENLENSLAYADYDQLLRLSGLLDTLRGPGPYTVFALVDPAIDNIPQIYRDRMVDPANASSLRRLMAYTIVPGRFTAKQLVALARKSGGRVALRTIDGDPLTVTLDPANDRLGLADPEGRTSYFKLADIRQSNGLLYTGSRLLTPTP